MRIVLGVLYALFVSGSLALSAGSAAAADDEGVITAIDRDELTITLDNGNSYKLPAEFDVEALEEGMDILLAYDTVAGEKLITDMEIE